LDCGRLVLYIVWLIYFVVTNDLRYRACAYYIYTSVLSGIVRDWAQPTYKHLGLLTLLLRKCMTFRRAEPKR
jgi:succinate dehydrogenase hydrophobic anchor subunit